MPKRSNGLKNVSQSANVTSILRQKVNTFLIDSLTLEMEWFAWFFASHCIQEILGRLQITRR